MARRPEEEYDDEYEEEDGEYEEEEADEGEEEEDGEDDEVAEEEGACRILGRASSSAAAAVRSIAQPSVLAAVR